MLEELIILNVILMLIALYMITTLILNKKGE